MNFGMREVLPTSLPWRAGWYFNVGMAAIHARLWGPSLRIRTLSTPGDLAPVENPPTWTFHLGLAAKPTRPVCAMRADGFVIEFSWDGRVCQVVADMVAPGILAGITDAPLVPTLFSATREVHRSENVEWILNDPQHIVLIRRREGSLLRFVLAHGTGSHHTIMGRAQSALDTDPYSYFAEGSKWRAGIFQSVQNTPFGTDALCVEAVETLIAHTELPCEQMPYMWCATELKPRPTYDVNQLYALTAAWAAIEPSMAEDIVRTTMSLQRHDGALPCRLLSGGSADYSSAPLPLFVQAVAYVVRTTRRLNLARAVWTAMENYLAWSLEHFAQEIAPPRNHASAHSDSILHSRQNERGGFLALLLLAEIQALYELSQLTATSLRGFFWTEAERLGDFIERHPWVAWAIQKAHETQAAHRPPTIGPLSMLALSCPMIPETVRNSIADYWERASENIAEDQDLSWSELILLIETARRASMPVVANKLTAMLWRRTQAHAARATADSQSARPPASTATQLDAGLASAVLYAAAPHIVEPRRRGKYALHVLDWAEKHIAAAMAVALFLPLTLFLIGVSVTIFNKTLPMTQRDLYIALAQELYRSGQYKDAAGIFEQVQARGPRIGPLPLLLGNAYYRAGDFDNAEKHFRTALERKEQAPVAMLNLALTLYRQGRHDESAALYSRFLEEYESRYPSAANRARIALELLQQQSRTNRLLDTSSLM